MGKVSQQDGWATLTSDVPTSLAELGKNRKPAYNEAYRGWFSGSIGRGLRVLTEQEVSRSWSRLFKSEVTEESFDRAEALLDELRAESPLRHRLGMELEELRAVAGVKS